MNQSSKLKLFIILLVALGLRLWALFAFPLLETLEEDALSRLWIAVQWVEKGNLLSLPSMGWLPGHGILLSLPLFFGLPAIASSQILTLLFGLGFLWVYYQWIEAKFGERIGLSSTAILAVTPLYVYYSTIPLSEIPALCFVAAGLWLLERKRELIAALFLALACTLRLEAWPLVAIIAVAYGVRRKEAFAILALWPLSYTVLSYLFFGVPNQSLVMMSAFAQAHAKPSFDTTGTLLALTIAYGAGLWFSVLAGPFLRRSLLSWGVAGLGAVILVSALRYNIFYPRYFTLIVPLLLPFALERFKRAGTAIVILSLLANIWVNELARKPNFADSGFYQATDWVKTKLSKDDRLYFDGGLWAEGAFFLATERSKKNTSFNHVASHELGKLDPTSKILRDLSATFPEGHGTILFNQNPEAVAATFLNRPEVQAEIRGIYRVSAEETFGNYVIWTLAGFSR